MRLLIFSSDIYGPCFMLSEVLKKYNENIIELVCGSRPLMEEKGKRLRRYFQQSGFKYFYVRSVMRGTLGFCDKICSFLHIRRFYKPSSFARALGIPVSYTTDYNAPELIAKFSECKPDYLISCCVGQKLSEEVLGLARKKAINIHFAPLPKYGGIAPVIWAMSKGEKETAVTVHVMAKDFDSGDILSQRFVPIDESQSYYDLLLKQTLIGQRLLVQVLQQLEDGTVEPIKQDLNQSSYFSHPDVKQIKEIRRRGHPLLRTGDIFRWIKSGPRLEKREEREA